MSEATEFVIANIARTYSIDGEPIEVLAKRVAALSENPAGSIRTFDNHDGKTYSKQEAQEITQRFFRETGLAKLIFMPKDLLTAQERFMLDVFNSSPGFWTEPEVFVRVVRDAFASDQNVRTTVEQLQREVREARIG